MELEHRVGQLLIVGIPGPTLDDETRRILEQIQPGGVILQGHNIGTTQELAGLTSALRSVIRVPPLVAIDQEGGPVDRLKAILSPMPSPELLRASNDASIAGRLGEITAEALRTLGFNLNFAPVLDVSVNDSWDNGLKGRYLGKTGAEVVRLSGAYLEGLQRGGIVGVGKHFPGLGFAETDPHTNLPQVDTPRDQILKDAVQPYAELFSKINARLNAIIVAPAHYTAFDGPAPLPAVLSKNIVTVLLRDELGFKGLAITDDILMGAVTSQRTVAEAAVNAIEAGNDMVMVCRLDGALEAWEAMGRAARDGRVTRQRISRNFDNIARVKSMISPPHPFSESAISRLRERVAELNLALQQTH